MDEGVTMRIVRLFFSLALMVRHAHCQRIVVSSPNYPFQMFCCHNRNTNIYQVPSYSFNVPGPRMPSMPHPIPIPSIIPASMQKPPGIANLVASTNFTASTTDRPVYTEYKNRIHGQNSSSQTYKERVFPRTYPYSRNFFNRNLKRGAPIVTTALGSISGRLITTNNDFRMLAYLGIPYAQRPVRFERANPRRSFGRGIFDASKYGPTCPMATLATAGVVTLRLNSSEDCLSLKIVSPENKDHPLPVLFWIHGGGFVAGSNQESNLDALGDNIVSKGVIVAQPNYRLGPFGFWSSMTDDAAGNYALWDVLTALQFVHREITAFGGDPNRIFLMGQGAGAILAETLSLSPLARGLFSGIIQLSGTAFDPRVNLPEGAEEDKYKRFVQAVGCDDENGSRWKHDLRRKNAILCLRQKSVLQLLQAQSDAKLMNTLDWHPRVDGNGGILPQSFEKLARIRPTYPVLMGSTAGETAWDMIVSPLINEFKSRSLTENIKPSFTLPTNIFNMNSPTEVRRQCNNIVDNFFSINADSVREACHKTFVDDVLEKAHSVSSIPSMSLFGRAFASQKEENNPYFWLRQAIEVSSSFFYHAPIVKTLGYHLANGNRNVYLYSLDYERVQDGQWWEVVGSFHNLDMALIEDFFPSDLYRFKPDDKDKYVRDILTDSISSFAGTGVPAVPNGDAWKSVNMGSHDYYSIALPVTMRHNFREKFVSFWNEVVPSLPQRSLATTTQQPTFVTSTPFTVQPKTTSTQYETPLVPWVPPEEAETSSSSQVENKYFPSNPNGKLPGVMAPSGISGLIPNPYFPYRPTPVKPASGPIPMPNILPFKPPELPRQNRFEYYSTAAPPIIRTFPVRYSVRPLPRIYPIHPILLNRYTTRPPASTTTTTTHAPTTTTTTTTTKPLPYNPYVPATTKLIPIYVASPKPTEDRPGQSSTDADFFSTGLEWIKNFLPPILSSLRGKNGEIEYGTYPRRGMVQYNDGLLRK